MILEKYRILVKLVLSVAGLGISPIACNGINNVEKLEMYNVDHNSITISGFSSGGNMAMQFHLAYSSKVFGAGILAAVPFGCAADGREDDFCNLEPERIDTDKLFGLIGSLSSSGKIDDLSGLFGSPAFVIHGLLDDRVYQLAGRKVVELYEKLGAEVETEFELKAAHGFPTDFHGPPCNITAQDEFFINNCNYNAAHEVLNYLHNGTLISPPNGGGENSIVVSELIHFDQEEFGANDSTGMNSIGYLYVPTNCLNKTRKCRFHISLHGCRQHRDVLGELFATKTGYLQVAEINDIIVMFPQTAPSINSPGCWDWWGFSDPNFLNRDGVMMKTIANMMNRAALCDGDANCFKSSTSTLSQMTSSSIIIALLVQLYCYVMPVA